MADKDEFAEDEELLAQMRADFLSECGDIIDELGGNLVELEKEPENEQLISEIFRAAHTIKGSSGFVSLDDMRELAHRLEDLFSLIRDRVLAVSPEVIDVATEATARLGELRSLALAGAEQGQDLSDMYSRIENLSAGASRPPETPAAEEPSPAAEEMPAEEPAQEPAHTTPVSAAKAPVAEETLRISSQKLDGLIGWVSELVTARNQLLDLAEDSGSEALRTSASSLARITSEIQAIATQMRMIPLEVLFKKYPSVVRTLGRDLGKEVDLQITGKNTEVDKNISELLADPLVHILRNSVDHGIEKPGDRAKAGKGSTGIVHIDARRVHNSVLVTISDDGAGLDLQALRQKAVEKGLLSAEQASSLAESEVTELIFLPGMSTSKEVSEVSGRGVGMDVVRANLSKLRGAVTISSQPGKGTTVHVKVPLTMAIAQVLLVKVAGQSVAVPTDSILETMTVSSDVVHGFGGHPSFFYRGKAIALFNLEALLGRGEMPQGREEFPVIVVSVGSLAIAVSVESFVGKQEVVVKDFGHYIGTIPGVAGGAITSDGSVAMVLDMPTLLRAHPGFVEAAAGKREVEERMQPGEERPSGSVDESLGEPAKAKILFKLSGVEHAIPADIVSEIVKPKAIDPIPESADCIEGVVDLHGEPVVVVDLGCRMGLPRAEKSREEQREEAVMFIRASEGLLGVKVDSVIELAAITGASKEPPPGSAGTHGPWLRGVVYRRGVAIMMLDERSLVDSRLMLGMLSKSQVSAAPGGRLREAG